MSRASLAVERVGNVEVLLGACMVDLGKALGQASRMATASPKQIAGALNKSGTIDVKQAVGIATRSFAEFYPALVDANLMLEEIEESDDGKSWLITLGYDARRPLSKHALAFGSDSYRAYKIFKIDNTSGKVASMKIRTVE